MSERCASWTELESILRMMLGPQHRSDRTCVARLNSKRQCDEFVGTRLDVAQEESFENGNVVLSEGVVGWQCGVLEAVDAWGVDADQDDAAGCKFVHGVRVERGEVGIEHRIVGVCTCGDQDSW